MSDFPIQKSSPDELAGGQKPLTSYENTDEQWSRCGFKGTQRFPLTGAKFTEVNNDVPASLVSPNNANGAASRDAGDVSGMNVGAGRAGIAVRVDQVNVNDFKAHQVADKKGDVAKDSLTQAAVGQGGPRSSTGQFPNGRADTAGKGGRAAAFFGFGNEHANRSWPEIDTGD
jgi:hypothetical protein